MAPCRIKKGIEGVEVDDLPFGLEGETFSFAVIPANHKGGTTPKMYSSAFISEQKITEIREMIARGGKVIQLTDESEQLFATGAFGPKSAAKKHRVKFLVTEDVLDKRIPLDLVPYKAGGHQTTRGGWRIKQARVKTVDAKGGAKHHYHTGDVSFFHQPDRASAVKFSKAMEEGRQRYLEVQAGRQTPAEFDAWAHQNLPFELDYKGWKREVQAERIDPNSTFHMKRDGHEFTNADLEATFKPNVARGDKIIMHRASQLDTAKDSADLRFAQQQDDRLYTLTDELGSESSPVVNRRPSDVANPFDNINVTLEQLARDRNMSALRDKTATELVERFHHLLNVGLDVARRNPHDILDNLETYLIKGAPSKELSAVRIQARAWKDLSQARTFVDRIFDRFIDDVILEGKGGKLGVGVASALQGASVPSFLRKMAFITNFGGNMKQVIQQMAQLPVTVSLLGAEVGGKAMSAAGVMAAEAAAPGRLAKWAENAFKTHGFTPQQYRDMREAFTRSGFNRIQGSTVYGDHTAALPPMYTHARGVGRDALAQFGRGAKNIIMTPFTSGEWSVRATAFSGAYMEFVRANKIVGRALTNSELLQVNRRAGIISGNMLKDAAASWQKGILGTATQFFSFSMRNAELMMGKNLTGKQRASMIAAQAIFWGVPITAGAATGVIPIGDIFDRFMVEEGGPMALSMQKDAGFADFMRTSFMKGVPQAIFNAASEGDTDIAALGPGAITVGYNIWNEHQKGNDFPITELVLGASNRLAGQDAQAGWNIITEPFTYTFTHIFGNDPLTSTEEMAGLWNKFFGKVFAGYSNAERAWIALSTERLVSRSGRPLKEDAATTGDALRAVLGLHTNEQAANFHALDLIKAAETVKIKMRRSIEDRTRRFHTTQFSRDPVRQTDFLIEMGHLGKGAGLTGIEVTRAYIKGLSEEQVLDLVVNEKWTDMGPDQMQQIIEKVRLKYLNF